MRTKLPRAGSKTVSSCRYRRRDEELKSHTSVFIHDSVHEQTCSEPIALRTILQIYAQEWIARSWQ